MVLLRFCQPRNRVKIDVPVNIMSSSGANFRLQGSKNAGLQILLHDTGSALEAWNTTDWGVKLSTKGACLKSLYVRMLWLYFEGFQAINAAERLAPEDWLNRIA